MASGSVVTTPVPRSGSFPGASVQRCTGISGFVVTGGDVVRRIDLPPSVSTSVLVKIDAPENGTEWNYTVGCPG